MIRNLGVERTFFLGDYKSLKVTDHINDLPEEFSLNEEFINILKSLQLIGIEKAYYEYSLLTQGLKNEFPQSDGKRYEYLQKLETNAYENAMGYIINILNKKGKK